MKTEIITKEKPKEFEPFELRITFETQDEVLEFKNWIGDVSGKYAHVLYEPINDRLKHLGIS